MTIELYSAASTDFSAINSPISNTTGELPEQEPDLNFGDLLDSFDSREEALAYIEKKILANDQLLLKNHITPFNAYTHVELLTLTIQHTDQSVHTQQYYFVTDEGY